MSEPLARSAGNALEVREAIAMLRGETSDPRLLEVTMALGAEVMVLGKLAKDAKAARSALARSITSGGAAERFARMVVSLGGPANLVEKPDAHLARAPSIADVPAPRAESSRHRYAGDWFRGRDSRRWPHRRRPEDRSGGRLRPAAAGRRAGRKDHDRTRARAGDVSAEAAAATVTGLLVCGRPAGGGALVERIG